MTQTTILDASALIALFFEETGMKLVEKHLAHAEISAVNWSEVVAYMIKKGFSAKIVAQLLEDLAIPVINFDEQQAITAGYLIEKTAVKGLSFGDRACLALALSKDCPVLTADKAWLTLKIDLTINLIR